MYYIRISLAQDSKCRWCMENKESTAHSMCCCPALARDLAPLKDLENISNKDYLVSKKLLKNL